MNLFAENVKKFEDLLKNARQSFDKKGETKAYCHLGITYYSVGKYQEAIKYHEKFLSTAVDIGDKNAEASAYGNLGLVYSKIGKYQEAIKYQEKLLNIAIELGNKYYEGKAYETLGVVHRLLAKYEEAIKYNEKRLSIAIEIGDKEGEGISYGNLGTLYQSLGKYQKAIKYHVKRLSFAKEIGDKKGEGAACGNLGVAYDSLGKHQEAIKYQKMRLSIAEKIGDKEGEGIACGNLGVFYSSLGKYAEALKYQEKCLSVAVEIGDKNGEGRACGNLGTIYQVLGNCQEAKTYNEKSLSIAIEIGDKEGEGVALNHLGFLYLALTSHENGLDEQKRHDSMNKSVNFFKDALKCFEWQFDHLEGRDQFKISIVDRFIEAYQALTRVLVILKQSEEALLVSERGRARALGDLLASKYSLSQGYESRSNLMTYDDVETLLSNSKYSIFFFALYYNYVAFWCLTDENPLGFHQKKFRLLEATISGENEDECSEVSLAEIAEAAFDKMQIRAPVNCEDRSLDLLEEDEGSYESEDITGELTILAGQGNNVSLESNDRQENRGPRCLFPEEEEDPLELLYESLVAPLQEGLTPEEIVIIPDGILFKIPFAALRDRNTDLYLSDTKRIRLAPSLTTLKALQESPADYHSRTGALIVGNPAVEEVMIKGEKKRFQRLPGAECEANEISKLMGVMPLIGAQATKKAIKRRLQDGVGVVHIASHGSSQGKILLAPCSSVRGVPEEEDCMLTMKEVQESGVRAQLVVLSCCHSGRGKIGAEGVVGLTRAFLAAGARAVVASLWAIDDAATKLFMLRFYTHLKSGESASASIQKAMKEMKEITRYSEPKYWAAFFLIGDDVKIVHQTIFIYALRRIFTKPHNLMSPSPGHTFVI